MTGVICSRVPEPRVPIANSGESEPCDGGILGGVREFVDIVRDEIRSGGQQADRCSSRVVRPVRGGNSLSDVVHVDSVRQGRLALIQRRSRIAQRNGAATSCAVFVRRSRDRRAVCFLGNRERDRGG